MVLMVLDFPALLLTAPRDLAGACLTGVLDRTHARGVRSTAGALSWAVGIVGVGILLNTGPVVLQHIGWPTA